MSNPTISNDLHVEDNSEDDDELLSNDELSEDESCSVAELCKLVMEKKGNDKAATMSVMVTPSTSSAMNITPRRLALNSVENTVNFDEESDPDVAAFVENSQKTRKRKRVANKSNWKRQINQRKRVLGESFEGFQRRRDESGALKFSTGIQRENKKIGETCTSKYCSKIKNRHCHKFSKEAREEIFNHFWANFRTWQAKKAHVCSLIQMVPVKKKSRIKPSKRHETFEYSLFLDGKMVRVCWKMFLNTLSLGEKRVRSWVRSSTGKPQGRSPTSPREWGPEMKNAAEYVDMLPKLPSHYGRARSSKLYLEPGINSRNQLYGLYKDHCTNAGQKAVSKPSLSKILKQKNVSIWLPKKDQCDLCSGYFNKSMFVSEAKFIHHQAKKMKARSEKDLDNAMALEGTQHVIYMDLQAVKLAPSLQASALYYKTKLRVHNFTVYDKRTKHATCYLWDESQGDLSSSTFATCIRDFLQRYTDRLPIIIYSDGCTYQNRNVMLGNALLDMAMSMKTVIVHKYLERGHTQMEVDSVHSAIESELKHRPIWVPSDYINICQGARNANPYEVKYLDHTFFLDFTKKETQRYKSIRPDKVLHEKKKVTDVRQIFYSPDGSISYKLEHDELGWHKLPQKNSQMKATEFPRLFKERPLITARKYRDLQELLHVIPEEHHQFYTNLPREN